MKKILMIFLSLSMFLYPKNIKVEIDIITTKDGKRYSGKIIEQKMNEHIIIQIEDGSKIKLLNSNIDVISVEEYDKIVTRNREEEGLGIFGICGLVVLISILIGSF